jgi:hypothetical protein
MREARALDVSHHRKTARPLGYPQARHQVAQLAQKRPRGRVRWRDIRSD